MGRRRAVPVSDPRLRTGREDSRCAAPTAVLLLLRPHGSQQPAQLLREHARSPVRNVSEGALLLIPATPKGQNGGSDPRRDYQGGLEANRPGIGSNDQLVPSCKSQATIDSYIGIRSASGLRTRD